MKEWEIEYHVKQMDHPYRSTEKFVDWLEEMGFLGRGEQIIDMACGAGANTMYMANRFKKDQFTGVDYNGEYIDYGNTQITERVRYHNCKLLQGDWFDLNPDEKPNGIISFQALSWFPEYEKPLTALAELNPRWIAASSLFYEGDIDYSIKLKNYYRGEENSYEESYYNIYSLPRVQKHLKEQGYGNFNFIRFEIDIDLPKPDTKDLGTYTIKMEDGKRLQISGGLMMPWYFVVAYK